MYPPTTRRVLRQMAALPEKVKDGLLGKLGELAERHRETERLLSDPEVIADAARLTRLARQHAWLGRMARLNDGILQARQRRDEAEQLLEGEDEELRQLAAEEIQEMQKEEDALFRETVELLASDEAEADRSVIMEVRAGTGGEEAALFAADLFGMYTRYAEKRRWQVEMMDAARTDLGGLREVVFSVGGKGAWQKLRYESGGHRVQRVPETESQGRIHTSLATVAVLPEAEDVEVEINDEDLDVSFVRSTGPGGQHVNKTSSCVRIVHKPTGITVRCQDEKSQQANRKKAMKVLRARLYDRYQGELQQERDALRKSQVGSGDRNERVRTYNFPQDRITDHRIGLDLFGIENLLMGDCDRLFDALAEYDRQARIKAFVESGQLGGPT